MPHSVLYRVLLLLFVLTGFVASPAFPATTAPENFILRSDFTNSRIRFERDKVGHVAFLGGSITEMEGYRPLVMAWLKKRFPETVFTFTNAGIASTCSTTGAMRLQKQVLDKGPVDLFFVEFAVNDNQDANHSRENAIRGMEGIIAQVQADQPDVDVVMTHFVNPAMLKALAAGKEFVSVDAHNAVAAHHGISVNHVAQELADRIRAGTMTWAQFGGVHPGAAGNAMAAGQITAGLEKVWSGELEASAKPKAHKTAELMDPFSYTRGRFLEMSDVVRDESWELSAVKPGKDTGKMRPRFAGKPLLHSSKAGARLTVPFNGTAIGAFILAGRDTAIVHYSIDGGEPLVMDTAHRYSRNLHYPRTVMFANQLEPGKHTLTLEIAPREAHPEHTALRLLHFVAN